MPLSKIHVPDALPTALCREIGQRLHVSLVETCAVHADDNFCLISRYAADDKIIHPTFLGKRDATATIVIEITLLTGRSDTQKEALHMDFRRQLREIGLASEDTILFLVENSAIDWSFSDAGSVKAVLGV